MTRTFPIASPETLSCQNVFDPVLAVVYLVYNEGYLASGGDAVDRDELRVEAIRLARLVTDLMPDEPEAQGLLALLLLTESRAPARLTIDERLVRLAEQDRSLWNRELIDEGQAIVRTMFAAEPTWSVPTASRHRSRALRREQRSRH